MMTNDAIADHFSLLSKLMDIHGENAFKAKSYATAAFTIDKLSTPLSEMDPQKIAGIRGIGDSVSQKIMELLQTGQLGLLTEILSKTPPGILDMLRIKGIGPKKIATIWKELEIETLGELLYACNENRLTLYKGFGEKTQASIKAAIEFFLQSQGRFLYQQVDKWALSLDQKLKSSFPIAQWSLTGEFRRQMEIIDVLAWVTTLSASDLTAFAATQDWQLMEAIDSSLLFKTTENLQLQFFAVTPSAFHAQLFQTSCSAEFLAAWAKEAGWDPAFPFGSEDEIFNAANVCPIPPYQRETVDMIEAYRHNEMPAVIETADIVGLVHCHSQWSDGGHSLEEMRSACKARGWTYMVISDHSKSAFYANGLNEERLLAQQAQIDALNAADPSFTIFKSIESDILNDGQLDYAPAVLSSFDLVIASVHSNLKMAEDKAMMRLLRAIENPYTSILGHMTGRLLLSRNGYPIDHEKIIDACFANQVVIELNAHPRRLDIDWRWIRKALDKNVLLSINPDAHTLAGLDDVRYGVLVAQKAGLSKSRNLSSFDRSAFLQFVALQKRKRP